jgi:hypothetical protein
VKRAERLVSIHFCQNEPNEFEKILDGTYLLNEEHLPGAKLNLTFE